MEFSKDGRLFFSAAVPICIFRYEEGKPQMLLSHIQMERIEQSRLLVDLSRHRTRYEFFGKQPQTTSLRSHASRLLDQCGQNSIRKTLKKKFGAKEGPSA